MKSKSNEVFLRFIVKQAVVASAITFLIAGQTQKLASLVVDTLVEPLFSIDLDRDGNPDLKQLEKYVVNLFGLKFALGKLITQLVKFCVFIAFIYIALSFFMKYTNLIKL